MSILRATVVALLIASSMLSQPALAAKNNGAYGRSTDAAKKQAAAVHCSDLKDYFDANEKAADRLAGKKEAKRYADAADQTYADAHQVGCAWAQ